MQRVREDNVQEDLVALYAWVDAKEFADMEFHVDAKELIELERLWGEVATLRVEWGTDQGKLDEYHR